MPTHWCGVVAAIITAGVQFVLFLRWLHRRMRKDEIVSALSATLPPTICRTSTPPCTKSPSGRELTCPKHRWCALWTSMAITAEGDASP
jgi:hypothetical protein